MLALNFTPFPELKTERLLLRKLERTDANEMFFLRSNENVLRYAVVDYRFTILGLHSIEALLNPENIASSSVLERTVFIKKGHLKESIYFNGNFRDEAIYSGLK